MKEDITSFYNGVIHDYPFSIEMTGISYCDGTYKIERKNSSVYCFEYIIKGQGTVKINGESFTPVEGDVYFLQKGGDHEYFSHNENPWIKIWFNVKGVLVDHLIQAYKLNNIHHIQKLDLSQQFHKFLSNAQSKTLSTEEIFNLNSIIFHEIILKIFTRSQAIKVNHDPMAIKLKEYLDKSILDHISLNKLSEIINRSPSQTIRIFKKNYGITPYEYLLNSKIETAKLLLLNTNLQITEISYQLKFADEHYFSNYFKSVVGISPREFRTVGYRKT